MTTRLTVVLVSQLLVTPALIFWLWLMIHPPSVSIQCPEKCRCEADGYYVSCSYAGLKSIPSTVPTHVQTLVLIGNSIQFIGKDNFVSRGLVELEILIADSCKLRKIELGAFNGLTKLTYLSMQSNEIRELIPGTFEKISSLEYLDLQNNRIEHLESDVFYGLVNLKHLYLDGNKLQYLHPDAFLALPELQGLYISQNYGLQIPTNRHFINSHSLKKLSISACNVRSVSVETFANISELGELDLRYNYMNTVDINILKLLPYLSKMYLYGNPLQCDCQLQEVWRWCQDRNIETVYKEMAPECDTPSEVKGVWWGVLEKGQCLEGNINFYGDYNNTSYSYTPIEEMETESELLEVVSSFFKPYTLPVSAVLFTFGTIGNVILIIITCNKDMRNVSNMYILNLAISNMILLTLIFSIDLQSIMLTSWQHAQIFCNFFEFCFHLSFGLTAYSIAVFNFQEYRITVKPLEDRNFSQPTWLDTVAKICGIWIVAVLLALPAIRLKHLCVQPTFYFRTNYFQLVYLFELLVFCVIPLCVNAFSYTMISRHILIRSCLLSEKAQNPLLTKRKDTAKVVLGLTVVFLISYVPYHIFVTYGSFRISMEFSVANVSAFFVSAKHLLNTFNILKYFLSINSCLSPLVLFCASVAFRMQLKRYFSCCCKTKSSSAYSELSRIN